MLNKSDDIPYGSKLVTFIWKDAEGWHFTHNKDAKWDALCSKPKELFCAWTGNYATDIFEIDLIKAKEQLI